MSYYIMSQKIEYLKYLIKDTDRQLECLLKDYNKLIVSKEEIDAAA